MNVIYSLGGRLPHCHIHLQTKVISRSQACASLQPECTWIKNVNVKCTFLSIHFSLTSHSQLNSSPLSGFSLRSLLCRCGHYSQSVPQNNSKPYLLLVWCSQPLARNTGSWSVSYCVLFPL